MPVYEPCTSDFIAFLPVALIDLTLRDTDFLFCFLSIISNLSAFLLVFPKILIFNATKPYFLLSYLLNGCDKYELKNY